MVEKAAAEEAVVLAVLVKVEVRETAVVKAEVSALATAVAKAVVETVENLEALTAGADGRRRPARGRQSRPH